jgi:hypothetical protein
MAQAVEPLLRRNCDILVPEALRLAAFSRLLSLTNGGGSIQGNAINTVTISGDLNAQQGIL